MRADDALARILAGVPPLPSVDVAILDALGLVLDEEVVADRDVPPFRNSAMDGYAVRARDVADAPASLRVIGEIAAGRSPTRTVGPGEAMRIMTGAPVPEGADTVVRVEDTDNRSDVVTINAATPPGTTPRRSRRRTPRRSPRPGGCSAGRGRSSRSGPRRCPASCTGGSPNGLQKVSSQYT